MACNRVIQNSKAILTFHRFGNLMDPICYDFNSNCIETRQTQKDKIKQIKIHPVIFVLFVTFKMH